ncbi:DUF6785 family protein [Phycisphaerales bacterium AB-hyl4]|uniref:DUF6785 family protein n=1 Tax=Natronomicrosphaera hydrolytica TaxID=3242702 RepID=A0ABV4U2Y3_9BACT
MTIRAIILGLGLGIFISGFTHFNDLFMQSSLFINNHLPIAVFGLLVVLMLGVNPLLRLLGPRWSLGTAELAVIVALGLTSCGWPSFSFYRYFITITAMPNHWQGPKADWQAVGVMRYLPGGDPRLAEGHVQDWEALILAVAEPLHRQGEPVLERLWSQMDARGQRVFQEHLGAEEVPIGSRRDVVRAVNVALVSGDLTPQPPPPTMSELPRPMRLLLGEHLEQPLTGRAQVQLNRWWLVSTLPGVVLPAPQGQGVLLDTSAGGGEVLDMLLVGSSEPLGLTELPWSAWWPVLRVWGAAGLLLGLASLCLTVIVHPQWSRRELLPYPIARFVNELTERDATSWLPSIARHQAFWVGVIAMAAVHGVNGLHAWFPELPNIPLRMEFGPLRELFPNFGRIGATNDLFRPHIYFSVIAFCFFLGTPVSFSLGAATLAYGMLGATLLAAGATFQEDRMGAGEGNLLRFGAYVGMAGIIAYIGRRYYARLAIAAVGGARTIDTPTSAVWAARGLAVLFALTVFVLYTAGLDWLMAIVLVLLVLLIYLVLTRVVVETGMFFVQAWWLPAGILTGLLGFEAIGPTTFLVLAVGSTMLVGDPRTLLMPYLANAMQMADRSGAGKPGKVAPWLAVMLLVGFLVAGAALFSLTHNHGVGGAGAWDTEVLPNMPFDQATRHISESTVRDTLTQATAVEGLDRLWNVQLSFDAWAWMFGGMVLLIATAAARLRLPWWPIHPVLFLVWGTMPSYRLAGSFLIGWMIKLAVVQLGGTRGYRQVLPLMVGVIAGELLMGLVWTGASAAYYGIHNVAPPVYRLYP